MTSNPLQAINMMNAQESSNSEVETGYDPNRLVDALLERLKLKNDTALSRELEVAPPAISKIRHLKSPVGAAMLIRMHEISNLSIRELREIMGDRRTKIRVGSGARKQKNDG